MRHLMETIKRQEAIDKLVDDEQEWELYCEECGWIGNEDELKTAMLENEHNHQDHTLYETKVCPECRKNNFSK